MFCLPFKTNGLTERLNQTLSRALSKLVNEEHNDWDQKLDTILFAYRVSKQKSTGYSPFYMMFHRQPSLPIDSELLPLLDKSGEPDYEAFIEKTASVCEEIKEVASCNISKAQKNQKEYYDKRHSVQVHSN